MAFGQERRNGVFEKTKKQVKFHLRVLAMLWVKLNPPKG
jgi:hypothetical protein